MDDPAAVYDALYDEVKTVLIGKEDLVEQLASALFTRGHILLEGVPGVAKTTLANLFARASGLEYSRVQMTPDLLPADITGTHVYRDATGEFELQKGPIFGNIVLADELNRATPKTQSALLEAMAERAVTIEGDTLPLPDPFMVIATQVPIEREGTYELPVVQRDRFQLKLSVDLPSRDEERQIIQRFNEDPELGPADVSSVISPEDIRRAREAVVLVYVAEAVQDYILDLVRATRSHPDLEYGVSPRATLALLHTGKARAAMQGREYVIPDDVKRLAPAVIEHRLTLSAEAELGDVTRSDIVEEILGQVEPPGSEEVEPGEARDAAADGAGGTPEEED